MTGAIATFSNVVELYDERMGELVHPEASLQKLTDGAVHSEGPVYFPEDDSIVWSDAHGNQLLRWSAKDRVTVLRDPSNYQNGNYRDLEGRIVACSGGLRAIIRQEPDGEWRILCDRYQGKRLNSPNDLVVKSNGTIWFTDPPYGITEPNQGYGGEQEQPGSYVYCFDPATREIDAVITDMLRPNGLAFSPDEQLLYVSDSSAFNLPTGYHHVRVYDVVGQSVTNSRIFAEINPGQPDGLRVDQQGNVWVSSEDSIQVYAGDRTRLGKILVPETVANLTFTWPQSSSLKVVQRANRLIIAAGHSLYAMELNPVDTHGQSNLIT
jgi:gluconolactonase